MIIDCHGHYTTEPAQLTEYRKAQLEGLEQDPSFLPSRADLVITDDEIRERLEPAQLKIYGIEKLLKMIKSFSLNKRQ